MGSQRCTYGGRMNGMRLARATHFHISITNERLTVRTGNARLDACTRQHSTRQVVLSISDQLSALTRLQRLRGNLILLKFLGDTSSKSILQEFCNLLSIHPLEIEFLSLIGDERV
ncbi:hypothetical protein CB0940_05660, partial [Cercospora beticola]